MRFHCIAVALILFISLSSFAAEPSTQPADIAAAASQTREKLKTNAASWNVSLQIGPTQLKAAVIQAPHGRRISFSADSAPAPRDLGTIIERDGFWYVTDAGTNKKYRPFEAPTNFVGAYLVYQLAALQLPGAAELANLGTCDGVANGIATYHIPLAPALHEQVQNLLSQFDAFSAQNPHALDDPKMRTEVHQLSNLLQNGTSKTIDAHLGMITGIVTPKWTVRITDFRWLDTEPTTELNVDGAKWQDLTGNPTRGGNDELIAIGNDPAWQVGQPSSDMHACILNTRTGVLRRIPFQGVAAMPGCFSRDRKSVFVAGVDLASSEMGIIEVNLETGQNRKFDSGILASGMTLAPLISPDGKTLLAIQKSTTGKMLEWQVCLIDLATNAVKTIGQPIDAAFFSWLPDQSGFIMDARQTVAMDKPTIDTISRMDMNGNVTAIHRGSMPLLLGDGKTILFVDQEQDKLWKTCDLNGQNVKLFGDGLAQRGFPTLSPDGKRIVFMKFDKQNGPRAMIYDVENPAAAPQALTDLPGLWAMPQWN